MAGIKVKDYVTVIMDGSDTEVVRKIVNVIDKVTAKKHGVSTEHVFDDDHPTMVIIKTKTTNGVYKIIQNVIDTIYPGLCVFNPPM